MPRRPSPIPSPAPFGLPLLAALMTLSAQAQSLVTPPATGSAVPANTEAATPLRVIRGNTPGGTQTRQAIVLRADQATAKLGQQLDAQGAVELRQGDTLLRAATLSFNEARNEVRVPGTVRVEHLGSVIDGRALRLELDTFLGELLEPTYRLAQTGGSGTAARLDFEGEQRVRATTGSYSSCRPEGDDPPAWELRTDSLTLDLAKSQGSAQGVVLRFLDVPILAAPSFTFPLGDQRMSGWLPPHIGVDNRSGVELAVPYYFNLADNYDATVTPFAMTRRGAGVDAELRGLLPVGTAAWEASWLPHDRVAGRSRWSSHLVGEARPWQGLRLTADVEGVSDADYWKDLRRRIESPTPRLLARDLQLTQDGALGGSARWQGYARIQGWQVLQTQEASTQITAPYQREPQVGLRLNSNTEIGGLAGFMPRLHRPRLEGGLELEYNRFTLPSAALSTQDPGGQRLHALAHVALPVLDPGWWVVPQLQFNAASYRLNTPLADGRRTATRVVPTFSIDAGMAFERDTRLLGRPLLQSLEPRLLFVNTPYRRQDNLPNFDSAPRDFNADALYATNPFTGIDRVADARTLSFGAVSRWLSPSSGEEQLRLGLVQRYQFRDQRITADAGTVNRRFSDVVLSGGAHLSDPWWLDGAIQYDPELGRSVRSVLRARYSPGNFKTVSLAYRLQRTQSEQLDLAWQWPLFGKAMRSNNASCKGAWYSAGRIQYSLRESRITDSLLGLEYDAGCYVVRIGVERLSTGLSQTNTRFLLQLELVGLSRLGSSALKVLRDNVPGYRPLASDDALSVTP